MKAAYQPERGDFIHCNFNPQAGTEQAGPRPALVLSTREFNIGTGLLAACPITSTGTGSKFEVPVPKGARLHGFVLTHQFKTLDWIARDVSFHSKSTEDLMCEVLGRIEAILSIDC